MAILTDVTGMNRWSVDEELAKTDARRKGSVCSAETGGDEKAKLGACELKNNVSSSMREAANIADGASAIFLGHLGTHYVMACGGSLP